MTVRQRLRRAERGGLKDGQAALHGRALDGGLVEVTAAAGGPVGLGDDADDLVRIG